MKRLLLTTLTALMLMPLTATAQDDMYFVPTKSNVKKSAEKYGMPKDTYYCGSKRDVDEYNRRLKSKVEVISDDALLAGNSLADNDTLVTDTLVGDTIVFIAEKGVYPKDNARMQSDNDYKYTRNMSRWDNYEVSNAYWNGYNDGRFNRWYGWSSFYDPWYYSSWYGGWYDPWLHSSWYGGWYGGWYGNWYGWHGGWYDPWYYSWYGGYYPYYPIYVGGGGHHTTAPERFTANRYDRSSIRRVGSGVADRDRMVNNSFRRYSTSSSGSTMDRSRFSNNQRYNNTRNNGQRIESNRQSSSWNNNSNRSWGSSSGSGSFGGGSRSGGTRSSGGSVRGSGYGVRMGR